MIIIGNDKLFSESEILKNIRDYVISRNKGGIEKLDFEINLIAAALGENVDFMKGALK
jgi:hypothetical protein